MKQTTMNLWLQIHALWDRLEMEESEREIFKKDKDSFKPHVINGLKEEVARCEKLKFQNVQRFVEGIRRELLHWWEKCFYSRKQMDEFEPLTDGESWKFICIVKVLSLPVTSNNSDLRVARPAVALTCLFPP